MILSSAVVLLNTEDIEFSEGGSWGLVSLFLRIRALRTLFLWGLVSWAQSQVREVVGVQPRRELWEALAQVPLLCSGATFKLRLPPLVSVPAMLQESLHPVSQLGWVQHWECSSAAETDDNVVLKGMKNVHRECLFAVSSNPTTMKN